MSSEVISFVKPMTAEKSKDYYLWHKLEQARKAKAASGGYAGYGSTAFGQESVHGALVDNPAEQQIIDLIRRHHKSGKSLPQVATWLNQQGYTTKRGSQWRPVSVKRVLDRLYGKTPRISGMDSN